MHVYAIFKRVQIIIVILLLFSFSPLAAHNDSKPQLVSFAQNTYSQWGEDGIIKKIFELIGPRSKVCIEFGAWDGFHLSNTANLWTHDPKWQAILIECDPNRFQSLVTNTRGYNCFPICRSVGFSENDSLERILCDHAIPFEIDLLSIDIDGDDYYVLESLTNLRPRVIICEHNPTLPAFLDIYGKPGNDIGCSVAALNRIASSKGYSLVAVTTTNSFFVLDEELEKFAKFETAFEKITKEISKYYRYVITDYSGKYATITPDNFMDGYGITTPMTQEVNRYRK